MQLPYSKCRSAHLSVLLLGLAICLTGCSTSSPSRSLSVTDANGDVQSVPLSRTQRFLGILSPYRIDIQQGNFISSETMAQVKEAMKRKEGVTREQVRFAMGTPLLADVFHADRWDYPFRLQKGNGDLITSHVTLYFKDNLLTRIEGSTLPTEKDYVAMIAGKSPTPKTASTVTP